MTMITTTIMRKLSKEVRVFCLVQSAAEFHDSRAIHIQATWGKRCDKLLFVSERNDSRLPIFYVDLPPGRQHLTVKQRLALDHVYQKYLNDFDWFYKADDDTYVIVENLRQFLASKNASDPVYFGHHFKAVVKPSGYLSGGSGYVFSREALRRWGTRPDGAYPLNHSTGNDVWMGEAMQMLGVRVGDSRDEMGLERFYVLRPQDYVIGKNISWMEEYDKYPQKMVSPCYIFCWMGL